MDLQDLLRQKNLKKDVWKGIGREILPILMSDYCFVEVVG